MTTEDDFQAALDANPKDWQTRLVFADWLEERNDPRAEGYRALGVLRLRPSPGHHYGKPLHDRPERWWARASSESEHKYRHLPADWYRLVDDSGLSLTSFRGRRKAEDAAARAFAKLPAERRAELLAGGNQS